jgi:hypothetical protein
LLEDYSGGDPGAQKEEGEDGMFWRLKKKGYWNPSAQCTAKTAFTSHSPNDCTMERHRDANSYEHADYQDEKCEEESEEEVCGHGG